MTDYSKPTDLECPECGKSQQLLVWCTWCGHTARMIPCFPPLAVPEPSVIHDMAELEVVTVPPMMACSTITWFMPSDARCGDNGERHARSCGSESDIPRIAETSARLREEAE